MALVLVAAVVIGEVAADVVKSGATASGAVERSYAAAVVPLVEESTALRLWLSDVRQHPVRLGRLGLETALGHLVSGARDIERQSDSIGVPPSDHRAAVLLSAVLSQRAAGAQMVAAAVALGAGAAGDVTAATAILSRAGEHLARSDRDYRRFLATFPAAVRRSVPLAPSQWYVASQWTPQALSSFANLIRVSPDLLVHRSLTIVALSLRPAPLRIVGLPAPSGPSATARAPAQNAPAATALAGVPISGPGVNGVSSSSSTSTSTTTSTTLQVPPAGSVSCLQPTGRVAIEVVVANSGNVAASDVELSATLRAVSRPLSCEPGGGASGRSSGSGQVSSAGVPAPGEERTVVHRINVLPAGTSQYIVMPPMPVHGGGPYVLTVRLGAETKSVTLQVAEG